MVPIPTLDLMGMFSTVQKLLPISSQATRGNLHKPSSSAISFKNEVLQSLSEPRKKPSYYLLTFHYADCFFVFIFIMVYKPLEHTPPQILLIHHIIVGFCSPIWQTNVCQIGFVTTRSGVHMENIFETTTENIGFPLRLARAYRLLLLLSFLSEVAKKGICINGSGTTFPNEGFATFLY